MFKGRLELSPLFLGLCNLRPDVSPFVSVSLISSIGPIFYAKVLIMLMDGAPVFCELLTPLTVPLNLNSVLDVWGFSVDV